MFRRSVLLLLAALTLPASAQFTSSKVSLYTNWLPSVFGSSSGNDCWGYVSPSGREYALVGLNNKVAFIEVTNPSAPVLVGTVPHPSSSWGDIKVYGRYAYIVAESTGSGLQVVDMANIDSVGSTPGSVTLVRTISSPGRSHNLHIDEVSGYLYTLGSREGTGWTTCWSLANPSNPVRVGPSSLSGTAYLHDCQVKTYTSGPLAGKQIMFGASEGRGLDIYDVTNKNAVVLMKRITYPGVAYSHQGWLSEDAKYFYLDDELDEQNLGSVQKTFVFDVSDPANAFLAGTFTRNEVNIDHNQYTKNGFIFQANYTRGLRIYDGNDDPISPAFVGFFDTHPETNGTAFEGSWSNYPFLPSGNVVVSDINRGFFLVNVSQATQRLNVTGTVDLEAFPPGTSGQIVDIEVRRTGQPTIFKEVALSPSGSFAFTLNNTLAGANCTITVQGTHWLRKATSVTLGPSGFSGLNVSLINGDIDGDNAIDIGDYAILSSTYGTTTPLGDLNGDGDVDISDYAILSYNFGLNGDL
ncbi:MAG: choice-of-anchor B family protein [Fimbriimonadaceae bacterium]|nr:choice-of-anchor B family protein [Fimbriimonadaceae bacterium]